MNPFKLNFYYYVSIINFMLGMFDTIRDDEYKAKYSFAICLIFWLFGMLKDIHNAILKSKEDQ